MKERLGAPLVFLALALVVAGPLLGDGYLLLLDFPGGPHAARPSFLGLPSSGGIASEQPAVALQYLVERIDPLLPQRLLLVLPVALGALGVYRLVRRRFDVTPLAALYGAALFAINPFVYDRYLAGHLYFLLAYGLLPWALPAALAQLDRATSPLVPALWTAVLSAFAVSVGAMYVLIVALVYGATRAVRRALLFAVAAAALCAYWLLPALVVPPAASSDVHALETYASRPSGFAVFPTLLALYGFWRNEFARTAEAHPALYLLLLVIVVLAALGFLALLERTTRRRDALVLGTGAGLGLLVAGAGSTEAFRWTYEHTLLLAPFREPQKLVALLVLAYAVLGAVGLHVAASRGRRAVRVVVPILAVAAAVTYGAGLFWGLGGRVQLAHYPVGWSKAARVMDTRGPGSLLVLPRDPYAVWPFSHGRIVASPARSFFDRDVVLTQSASLAQRASDPFVVYVDRVLNNQTQRDLGRRLAAVGVRYVAALPGHGGFLAAQRDLTLVYSGPGLALFENTAWRPAPRPLADISRAAPLVTRHDLSLPRVKSSAWLTPTRGRYVLTTKRCTDGWRLGDERAQCYAGAAAAFPSRDQAQPLWTPFTTLSGIGYLITFAALAALALVMRRELKS
jgi:hypothetical protein